jgi:hypothetical protein
MHLDKLQGAEQRLEACSAAPRPVSSSTFLPVAMQEGERPAAAVSVLSNERGAAVEDTHVLMDDLLLLAEPAPGAVAAPPPGCRSAAASGSASDAAAELAAAAAAPQPPTAAAAVRVALFGVYDGHGGGDASRHCARRLHHFVAARLRDALRQQARLHGAACGGGMDGASSDMDCSSSGPSSSSGAAAPMQQQPVQQQPMHPLDSPLVAAALREAFVETDRELRAGGALTDNSGSTAVVALVTPASIWLAWAGDSRAILVRGGEAAAATNDHRPAEREDEKVGGPSMRSWLCSLRFPCLVPAVCC